MTHQTNAQRLAELMYAYERELQECGFPEPTRNSYDDGYIYENESERFCLFRHMRERLSAIEQARDVAVEMAAQYAAERDQLRAQLALAVAAEREECAKVCESTAWATSIDEWRDMTKKDVADKSMRACAAAIRARGEDAK